MTLPVVAVVGRANVGKSTLVNRIVGRRTAIEHPEPGVTRDRKSYDAEWTGVRFRLVDTGGWEPRASGLAAKVRAQAERAVEEADLILLVLDVRTGITNDDLEVARTLRAGSVPVLVVANKVDSEADEADATALSPLGLGPALPVSALHGRGSGDLLDAVAVHLEAEAAGEPAPDPGEVRVAIVGRPNAGKSSLLNRLSGEDRAIVDAAPGTTRDPVDTVAVIGGERFCFVDTAGIRRRAAREAEGPEYYALVRARRAIRDAEVVLLVVDAPEGASDQDQRIAREVADAGRAAVVLLNKWDLIPGEDATTVAAEVKRVLRFIPWAPLHRISALTGRGIHRIAPAALAAREAWRRRMATAPLNTWLREAAEAVPLGRTPAGRPVRLRYATQVRTRPPEIVMFGTGELPPPALRGLERRLRDRFDLTGTPVRLAVRVRSPRGRH